MACYPNTVVSVASAEVGYIEKASNSQLDSKTGNPGSNNYTKYGRDMNAIYPATMDHHSPWCDSFVDWCFVQGYGVEKAKELLGGFDDYTPNSAQKYKDRGAWYTSDPQFGDQIFFKNSVRICHTGIVYNVDFEYVYTIEGNTSNDAGVVPNGGEVCKKSYKLTDPSIAGYGRPAYDGQSGFSFTSFSSETVQLPSSYKNIDKNIIRKWPDCTGVDITTNKVYNICKGVVVFVGMSVENKFVVNVQIDSTQMVRYCNLKSENVKPNQPVDSNALIGEADKFVRIEYCSSVKPSTKEELIKCVRVNLSA